MKLYHPEHGEWDGDPVDARIMLDRGEWQEKPIVVKPEPTLEEKPEPVAKRGRKAKE